MSHSIVTKQQIKRTTNDIQCAQGNVFEQIEAVFFIKFLL